MKIVKNSCYGGFGISPKALQEINKRKGKETYFFISDFEGKRKPVLQEQAEKELIWSAYSIPNPDFEKMNKPDEDGLYKTANEYANSISYETCRGIDRTDPDLIAVIEELGEEANGRFADLEIVEIPDDIEFEIDQYDGLETIREKHRTW